MTKAGFYPVLLFLGGMTQSIPELFPLGITGFLIGLWSSIGENEDRSEQDVEKECPEHGRRVRQLCSRRVWRLDVPKQSTPLASSHPAAALDGLFDHPAGCSDAAPDLLECCVTLVPKGFFNNLLGLFFSRT